MPLMSRYGLDTPLCKFEFFCSMEAKTD